MPKHDDDYNDYVDPNGDYSGDEDNGEEEFEGPPSIEDILDALLDIVEHAKSMPLSSSVMVNKEEARALLLIAKEVLPEEIAVSRRLIQENEGLRRAAEREAAEIIDEARTQAAFLVQKTEIARQAKHHAERLVEDAQTMARRIRLEAEDYVDRKLAGFEIILDKTKQTVLAGRERLNATLPNIEREVSPKRVEVPEEENELLFDQDIS